jgi:ABC-type polar amino acid transport system ATPase subunit
VPGAGHLFGYFPQEQVEERGDEDAVRQMSEYNPAQEFVVVLLKPGDRASTCRVGIAEHAHKLPNALSGREQQRAAIARAMANDPPIVVADEPTGNLDTGTADEVFALFGSLADQGKTLVVVTHDFRAASHADRVIALRDGRIRGETHLTDAADPQRTLSQLLRVEL